MTRTPQPGRAWSTFGFAVGIVASIAANIAHAYVVPKGAPAHWHPQLGAVFTAAFWPSAVVICIEVISRVQWAHRWYWTLVRFAGLGVVATIAAVISYGHLSALLRFYGEDTMSATIGPLAVDGLMVICSAALLAIGDNARSVAALVTDEVAEIRQPMTDLEPAEYPEYTDERAPRRAQSTRKPRSTRSDSNADRVAKAAARTPGATPAQLAARLNLSDATVRRYLKSDSGRTGTSADESADDLVPSAGQVINGFDHDLFADSSV